MDDQHRVFITHNAEYHVRGRVCVAVRTDRDATHPCHRAVGTKLEGTLTFSRRTGYRATSGDQPAVGDRLCFTGDIVTSPLTGVREPSANTLASYRAS